LQGNAYRTFVSAKFENRFAVFQHCFGWQITILEVDGSLVKAQRVPFSK
jgi:hypothetical protein